MKTIKCDKCKCKIECCKSDRAGWARAETSAFLMDDELRLEVDLCPDCVIVLKEWLAHDNVMVNKHTLNDLQLRRPK